MIPSFTSGGRHRGNRNENMVNSGGNQSFAAICAKVWFTQAAGNLLSRGARSGFGSAEPGLAAEALSWDIGAIEGRW